MFIEQGYIKPEQIETNPVINLAGAGVGKEVTYVGTPKDLFDMSLQPGKGTKGVCVEKLHWLINAVADGQSPEVIQTLFETAYGHGMTLVNSASKTGGESLIVAKKIFAQTLVGQAELSGDGVAYLPKDPTTVLQQQYHDQPQLLAINTYLSGLSAGIVFSTNGHGQPGEITVAPTEPENAITGFELLPVKKLTQEVLTVIQADPEALIGLLLPDTSSIESQDQLQSVLTKLKKVLKSYLNTRIKDIVEAKKASKTVVKMLPKGSSNLNKVMPYVFSQWSAWYEDKWADKAKDLTGSVEDSVVYPVAAELAYLEVARQVLVNDVKAGKIPAELAQKLVKFTGGVLSDYARNNQSADTVVELFSYALLEEGVSCGNGLLMVWEIINHQIAEGKVSSEEAELLKKVAVKIIGKVNVAPDKESVAMFLNSCVESKETGKPLSVCHFACPNYSDGSPSGLMIEGVGSGSINTTNTLISVALSLNKLGLNAAFNIVYPTNSGLQLLGG